MSAAAIATVKISESAGLQISHSRVKGKPFLTHWVEVQDYCNSNLANEQFEYEMVLCLDSQNRLIADETVLGGTVNQTSVYPRKIINLVLGISPMRLSLCIIIRALKPSVHALILK